MVALASAVTGFVCFSYITSLCQQHSRPPKSTVALLQIQPSLRVLGIFLMESNNPIYQWLSTVEDQEQSHHQDEGMLL